MRSKATAPTVLTLALLGVAMLSGAAFAQSGPAVSITPGSLYVFGAGGGGPITYGWKFQPKADLTITQLGFCDGAPFTGVGLDETHDVGIFDASGSLVVSATVPAGASASLVDNFWYVAIPPTVLSNGKVYTIGALLPPPMNDLFLYSDLVIPPGLPAPITLDSRVTWLAGVNDFPGGPALAFPTSPCCGSLFGFFGPTFFIASSSLIATVAIDIKPGTFPNTINLRSNGVVPVAILGSTAFDALQVDPASMTLAGAKVKVLGKGQYSCHGEDVNRDGRPDLLCQFPTSQLVIRPGASTVALEGTTFAGARFRGEDTIRIVPD
jgi:hypothetical protein